jgi:hypothetical protein
MTAEIAIMNKTAVALAADSAVTIGGQGAQKIFNTVNKLFTLSKYHPVAVMIFGNAEIMNVPWEIIIKSYRSKLGKRSLPVIADYAEDFLTFLARQPKFFPASEQRNYFRGLVSAFYVHIREEIEKEVQARLKAGPIQPAEVSKIVATKVEVKLNELTKLERLRGFGARFGARLVRKYAKDIDQLRKQVFQRLPLSGPSITKLRRMAGEVFVRDNLRYRRNSGLVFAGYGEKQVFPCVKAFLVEGLIENKLRSQVIADTQVDLRKSACIMPFAQSEVVRGFIDGIDPGMERLVRKFLHEVLGQYPIALLKHIPNLAASKRKALVTKLSAASGKLRQEFDREFERFQRQTLVDPVLAAVDVLPKDELAAMAESLVNLTSFKRKFSMDAETVGGPIDVAVISKGDGFVWIKRKHYFTKDLNPQFLSNYYKDV